MLRNTGPSRGQATTETMIMMIFVVLLIFGFVHMTMLIATKYMVNYAAFAAARTGTVGGNTSTAAAEVIQNLRWWVVPSSAQCGSFGAKCTVSPEVRNIRGKSRTGLAVRYRVPFGLPIFNDLPAGGIEVVAFAPLVIQPPVPNTGDNRDFFGP